MQHCAASSSSCPRRPPYRYLFLALASLIGSVSAQGLRIIGDSDPGVTYVPAELGTNLCVNTRNDDCRDKWFKEDIPGAYKGGVRTTQGPNSRVEVRFRGTQIVVKGVTADRGAKAFVTVDNGTRNAIDTDSPDRQMHADSILFSLQGLNANVEHTLVVEYDGSRVGGRRGPRLLRVDSFEIIESPSPSPLPEPQPEPSETDGGIGFPSAESTPAESTSTESTPEITPTSTPTFTPRPSPSPSGSSSSSTTVSGSYSEGTPDVVVATSNSTPTVPIVAGLATGMATLIIASGLIFFLLRRRRAVRIQSVELARSSGPSPAPATSMRTRSPPQPQTRSLANLAYAFNRRGSSVASSSDHAAPLPPPTQPLPPVPRIDTFVNPYTYSRRGPAYPRSDASSSIGLPVDERPPNMPVAHQYAPASPIAQSPRVLRVYNPDGSTVVSSSAH